MIRSFYDGLPAATITQLYDAVMGTAPESAPTAADIATFLEQGGTLPSGLDEEDALAVLIELHNDLIFRRVTRCPDAEPATEPWGAWARGYGEPSEQLLARIYDEIVGEDRDEPGPTLDDVRAWIGEGGNLPGWTPERLVDELRRRWSAYRKEAADAKALEAEEYDRVTEALKEGRRDE
jgi:hypothetical protein